MAFKNLTAFGAGELTPELHERGNLDKFRTGLKRLRNAFVTKAGGLRGRPGFVNNMWAYAYGEDSIRWFPIPDRDLLFKFKAGTDECVLYYGFNYETKQFENLIQFTVEVLTNDYVDALQCSVSENYVYCFSEGMQAFRLPLTTDDVPAPERVLDLVYPLFWNWDAATFTFNTTGYSVPTGYDVDYFVTSVVNGVESTSGKLWQGSKLPINIGEGNNVIVTIDTTDPDWNNDLDSYVEMRVYRRPRNGGGYGFIGICDRSTSGTDILFKFTDSGIGADYSNSPPIIDENFYSDTFGVITVAPKSGIIYQGRLVVGGTASLNKAFASRSGSTAFSRDNPIQDDSALNFKTGFEGAGNINRFLDSNGLFMFTNSGIYKTPSGLLTPSAAFADRKSTVVHDTDIIPLGLGSNILVFHKKLKAVIKLIPDNSSAEYTQDEISIFSNHLLRGRRITSWAIEQGDTQVVWMVLDNGKLLSLSYQEEQQLQSWAWHDTDGFVKDVFVQQTALGEDVVFVMVERLDGIGYLETLSEKQPDDYKNYIGSDGSVFYKNDMMPGTDPDNELRITPVVPTEWDGELLVSCTGTGIFSNFDLEGAIGTVFRFFRDDGFSVDFTVTQYIDSQHVKVTPSVDVQEFLPDNMVVIAGNDNLVILEGFFITRATFEGLDHLEGKEVSVRMDGFTEASPLNTQKNYNEYTVVNGAITLANSNRGAIVSIGLPYAQDIQTLPVDTVEESPVKLESQVNNKMHISYFESRGVFAAADYPEDDTTTGMDDHEGQIFNGTDLSITPIEPYTRRDEIIVAGSWETKGSMALRNVDPQPLGLRAIILDEEILMNQDR